MSAVSPEDWLSVQFFRSGIRVKCRKTPAWKDFQSREVVLPCGGTGLSFFLVLAVHSSWRRKYRDHYRAPP